MRRSVLCSLVAFAVALPSAAAPARSAAKKAAAAKAEALEHRERALGAIARKDDETAALELEKAIALDASDPVTQHELGKLRFKQGQLAQAIERFETTVKLAPKDSLAWYNLGYASRKAQQFERAAEAYKKCLALAPDELDAIYGLAESLRQAGKGADAVEAYKQYVAKENRASEQKWVQRSTERIEEIEGAAKKAAAEREAALKAAADRAAAERAKAAGAATATDKATAAGQPPKLVVPLQKPPEPAGAAAAAERIAAGDTAFAAKDYRGALSAYQDAAQADPKSVEAMVKIATAEARLGYDGAAIEHYSRALALDPSNGVAREGLAAAREREARRSQPVPDRTPPPEPPKPVQASQHVAPPPQPTAEDTARQRYARGVELIGQRQFDQAIAELNQAIALRPGYAYALIARGSARIAVGQYAEAAADYSAARAAAPTLAAPLFGMAEAFRALGQREKAAQLYREFAASNAPDAAENLKAYALQHAQALAPGK